MEIGSPTASRGIEETDGLGRPGRRAQAPAGMTSDLDIYRTANVLIRERGEEADLVPAERADSFLEAGDMAGSVVWKQVLKAIKETQRQERGSRELLQLSR